VAELIVDALEVIDVDQEQRRRAELRRCRSMASPSSAPYGAD